LGLHEGIGAIVWDIENDLSGGIGVEVHSLAASDRTVTPRLEHGLLIQNRLTVLISRRIERDQGAISVDNLAFKDFGRLTAAMGLLVLLAATAAATKDHNDKNNNDEKAQVAKDDGNDGAS